MFADLALGLLLFIKNLVLRVVYNAALVVAAFVLLIGGVYLFVGGGYWLGGVLSGGDERMKTWGGAIGFVLGLFVTVALQEMSSGEVTTKTLVGKEKNHKTRKGV